MIPMIGVTFIAFLIVVSIMAIGVMFGRKPISGSCGGLAQVGVDGECKICGRTNPKSCSANGEEKSQPLDCSGIDAASLATNAASNPPSKGDSP